MRAAADPKEQNKDEALFWLAHSQNQAGDSPRRREHPQAAAGLSEEPLVGAGRVAADRACAEAGSHGRALGNRRAAVPPPPPPIAPTLPAARGDRARSRAPARHRRLPRPSHRQPHRPRRRRRQSRGSRSLCPDDGSARPGPGPADQDRCAQGDPDPAQYRARAGQSRRRARAVFVLAQSAHPRRSRRLSTWRRPVRKPVRVAAVRELARFGGPERLARSCSRSTRAATRR